MALHEVTVANLLQDRYDNLHNIVVLQSNNTVEQALTKLNGHKIISAPVEFHSGQTKTFKMIDVMDIAVAVLKSNNAEIFHEPIDKLCSKLLYVTLLIFVQMYLTTTTLCQSTKKLPWVKPFVCFMQQTLTGWLLQDNQKEKCWR